MVMEKAPICVWENVCYYPLCTLYIFDNEYQNVWTKWSLLVYILELKVLLHIYFFYKKYVFHHRFIPGCIREFILVKFNVMNNK